MSSQSRQFLVFKPFSAGEENSYYRMMGRTSPLRTPNLPSPPAASENTELLISITHLATSVEMQSLLLLMNIQNDTICHPGIFEGKSSLTLQRFPLLFFSLLNLFSKKKERKDLYH